MPGTVLSRRAGCFALVVAAHVGLVWSLAELARRPAVLQVGEALLVRLIEPSRPASEVRPPPLRHPQPRLREPDIAPLPPVNVALAVETPTAIHVPPPVPAPIAVTPPPPMSAPAPAPALSAPVAVVAARFDADYLSNPKPVYPVGSRRLGEEGTVVLRVKVSPGGAPVLVEVKRSCGFPRLDDAARAAVEQWRFVPARRGDEPIESWVSVPIVFALQTS
jgi:protein TonB